VVGGGKKEDGDKLTSEEIELCNLNQILSATRAIDRTRTRETSALFRPEIPRVFARISFRWAKRTDQVLGVLELSREFARRRAQSFSAP